MRRMVLALGVALLLAGCSSTADTSQRLTPDQTFLTAIRSDMGMAPSASGDAALVADAHTVCKGFDEGMSFPLMVKTVMASDGNPLTARQWGELIGAAVLVYCPQHKGLMPN